MLTGLNVQQGGEGGPTQDIEEIIAFIAHALVPDFGIGFPGRARELVGILSHMPFLP
jgi:hypothetical protein